MLFLLYLFGSFSISSRTLSLLFLLHFITPFFLLIIIFIHLNYLHLNLSSNTNKVDYLDVSTFFPLYLFIDFFFIFMFIFILFIIIFFYSFFFFEATNFISFNTLVTPLHIYPD